MLALRRIPQNHRELMSLYIAFAVLMLINYYLDPSMLTINRMSTLLIQFMPLILVAIAQTLIMLTGGIDLSVGAVLSLMTTITAVTMVDSGMGIVTSIIVTCVCGMLIGLTTGVIVTYGRLPAIIVTLASSYIWHGVALFVLPIPGGHVAPSFTEWLTTPAIIPAGFIMIVVPVLIWKFVKNSKFGVSLYAVGDNPHAAYVSGIKTNKIRVMAYALAGLFIALAGIGLAGQTGTGDPNIGAPYTLNSIAAAVLGGISFFGGKGQIKGTIIGAIIIVSLMNILFFSGVSPFYQYIVQGLILIVAIGLRVLGRRSKGGVVA
ncbi:MAG: ABC transporter permease [Lysinibacillus sp.]